MKNHQSFVLPEITENDVLWASHLLGLPDVAFSGKDGTDPRLAVLKSMCRIDVAACPGSGKTTLLVAKLAILAEKWTDRTRGLCVLSHTNAARDEIENRLGNTAAGRRLLSYPHYIGTIHGFVNDFLAIPWLRSQGYAIKMIDTDVCQNRRWWQLPPNTRFFLEKRQIKRSVLSAKSSDFGLGSIRGLGPDTPTYKSMRDVCRQSAQDGYFCWDEMFVWADVFIDQSPKIVNVLRDRFPLLFIDEAQDNSEAQSAILYRVFIAGNEPAIRQRFGDENQAIFDFVGEEGATTDPFPADEFKKELPNSHRFGQTVAKLASPLGVQQHDGGLNGQGPKTLLASGSREGIHTIILFNEAQCDKVLEGYGELLVETFAEEELREGTFTAIGQTHRDKGDDHKPHHVGHYWADYDPELARAEPAPQTFPQYVAAGQAKAEVTGEAHWAVEKAAQGIVRLAGLVENKAILHRSHFHRGVLERLAHCGDARDRYEQFIGKIAGERERLTRETWDKQWRSIIRNIAVALAGASLPDPDASEFLAWNSESVTPSSQATAAGNRDNIYRYSKDGKSVSIRLGSIHSVKGKTHTATLVLETFWYQHNLELLSDWLCGSKTGKSTQVRQQSRLKLHYVAMTRPTHLLCLAMQRSVFVNPHGELDQERIQQFEQHGWRFKHIATTPSNAC